MPQETYTDLEDLQQRLEKSSPQRVYLKTPRPKSLAEIIHRMMILKEPTYCKITIEGEEKEQCNQGRARSIEDVYLVMRSYKKSTTLPHVYEAVERCYIKPSGKGVVIEDPGKDKKSILNYHDCGTVLRRVHYPGTVKGSTVENIEERIGNLNLIINAKSKKGTGGDKPKAKRKASESPRRNTKY